jgi:hypothetical protein
VNNRGDGKVAEARRECTIASDITHALGQLAKTDAIDARVAFDAEQRVPKCHPLRRIKALADATLAQLSPRFDQMYSAVGRPSIPPERLLKPRC